MSILVERGDEVIELPDCFCPTRNGIRIEHPYCPHPEHGRGGHWRVVALPARRKRAG